MVRLWEPSRTGEASLQNLTFAVKIVRYYGLWRTQDDTKTYKLYSCFVILVLIFAFIKNILFSISAPGDVSLFIESLSMVLGLTPTCVGTFLILASSGKFRDLVERIRSFISFIHSGEEHWKYEARGRSTVGKRKVTMYYFMTGQISLLSYLFKPILTNLLFGQAADFPMRQLVMFDNDSMLSFFMQYLVQIFICTFGWATVISLDVLFFNIIVSCTHQLELLACMILNVVNTSSKESIFPREIKRAESDFGQSPQSTQYVHMNNNISDYFTTFRGCSLTVPQLTVASEDLRCMEESLTKLSEWHQETLKTAEEIAKLLNAVMLCHYLFTSISLGMFTYNVQNSRGQSHLISLSSVLLLVFFRILILSWSSSELLSASLSVGDAAYFCNWYDLSLSAKKTLIIMMARAQRPVVIKAGPTGSLSLETCKKLLEAAYSYLNVLNNMK